MTDYPPALLDLIAALRRLPGVGARSAERLALFLAEHREDVSAPLARALEATRTRVSACPQCGFYAEDGALCTLCRDERRDATQWCVVEQAGDVLRMEKASSFRGLYHVLGGRLSPLDNIGPEQLRIGELIARATAQPPHEIVLALSADVEGETTALYLAPLLKKLGIKVTRLATGLPAGGGLEYADSVTLGYALSGRREV